VNGISNTMILLQILWKIKWFLQKNGYFFNFVQVYCCLRPKNKKLILSSVKFAQNGKKKPGSAAEPGT
jgi:hypothetical protein